MSTAGSYRRSARVASRAASNEPQTAPVVAPSNAQNDNRSVTSNRSSTRNRNRNQVVTSGNLSYGTRAAEKLTSQTTFQVTQEQAVGPLSGALGEAQRRVPDITVTHLPGVAEEHEGNHDETQVTQPADDGPSGQLNGDALAQVTSDSVGAANVPGVGEWIARTVSHGSTNVATSNENQRSHARDEQPTAYDGYFGLAGPGYYVLLHPVFRWAPLSWIADVSPRFADRLQSFSRSFWKYFWKYLQNVMFILLISYVMVLLMFLLGSRGQGQLSIAGRTIDVLPFFHAVRCPNNVCPPSDAKADPRFDQFKHDMRAEFENLQMSVHQKAVHPEIDYLSAQNDARIIPFLTSPQRMKKVSGLMRFFTKEVAYKKQQMVAGPVKDQKKMWCAPSTRGKAQITIRMAARMSPERLAITQNMAYSEALNLDSYPKEFELWAHVADDKAREAILAEVLQIYPDILTKTESQYDRHLAPEHTLPDSFVPLGRYSYDVRFNQAHQNWAVKTAISQYNVSTIAVAIRINSNWGNLESTCLHQVSLYGEHMDERKVYDDPTVGDVWPLW